VRLRCSLDGGLDFDCPLTGYALAGLADGTHTLGLRGWDAAGNEGRGLVKWTIDTQAPDTRIVAGPDASASVTTASFTMASEAGAQYECSLDAARFAPCSDRVAYGGVTPGAHAFAVRAIDAAGNVDQTPARHAWAVTAPPPDTAGPATDTPAPIASGQANRALPRVAWRAVANKRFTRITALSVEDLPAVSKATVSCRGKGCTLRKKVVSSKPGAKRLDLKGLLRKSKLRPGAVVTVRVAAPSARELVLRLKIQRGKAPKATTA
jgi:hypothetical protein